VPRLRFLPENSLLADPDCYTSGRRCNSLPAPPAAPHTAGIDSESQYTARFQAVSAVLGSVGEDWKPRIMLGCSVTTRGPEGCSWSELSAHHQVTCHGLATIRRDRDHSICERRPAALGEGRTARPSAGASTLATRRKSNPRPSLSQRGPSCRRGWDRSINRPTGSGAYPDHPAGTAARAEILLLL
jgi:hypothetical protein